jgi:hypothetical protein
MIEENATIERIVDLAGLPVFVGATVRTIILLTTPAKDGENTIIRLRVMPFFPLFHDPTE